MGRLRRSYAQNLLELAAEARTTEPFSPDCRYVLLLTDRGGPYHIIRTERMAAYVDGAKPDYVLDGEKTPLPGGEGTTGAGVFRGGGWTSSNEVAYTWGCCEPPITTRFVIPR